MAGPGSVILYLLDRLEGIDDLRAFRDLLGRVEARGHPTRVICLSAAPDHGVAGLVESPGLGRRWSLPWASRGLGLDRDGGRPRVLHVLGAGMSEAGLAVAERWRLPYLISIDEFPGRSDRLRLSRAWCRGIVATNPELASALVRDYGIPPALIRCIPRGVARPEDPEKPSRSGRVPVVGAAGPLVAASGFVVFLNAARKVVDAGVDAEFLIAGDGEEEAELRRRAERLRIADRLTFAEELAVGQTFWDALDVFCHTSLGPTTGRPLALAMAHGVPSVASDVEGLRALVADGSTGVRIAPGDPSALARAVTALLAEPDRARRLGEAARESIARAHRPDAEADRLAALYAEVAATGAEPGDLIATRTRRDQDAGPGTSLVEGLASTSPEP